MYLEKEEEKKKKKKKKKKNSRKSVRWSVVPVPCPSRLCWKLKGKQGSGPKGVNDLCFHTYGGFSPSPPSHEAQIPVSRPKSQSWGPNPSPKTQIPVSWPKSYPKGPNPSLKAQMEKISHMCEGIGHWPLWGHCPAPPSTWSTTYLAWHRYCWPSNAFATIDNLQSAVVAYS